MSNVAAISDSGGAENVSDQHQRRSKLLIVDADDLLVEMIETGLSLARPKWKVFAVSGPAEAMRMLEMDSDLDAIITEIEFDHSPERGKAFIRTVGRRWPEIPIFVMTGHDSDETRGLDTAETIAKPPDMDFLIGRVDRAIRRQKESWVRGISLPTFLQILELERKTCTVFVSHAGRVGEICFRKGKLIHAKLDSAQGEEALFAILSMREHSLRVIDQCEAAATISSGLDALLIEWSVRDDHRRRAPRQEEE